jgi:hypothetical protein
MTAPSEPTPPAPTGGTTASTDPRHPAEATP